MRTFEITITNDHDLAFQMIEESSLTSLSDSEEVRPPPKRKVRRFELGLRQSFDRDHAASKATRTAARTAKSKAPED